MSSTASESDRVHLSSEGRFRAKSKGNPMTTTPATQSLFPVTQSDREAAAPFANCLSDMQDIFDGKADGLPVVQAFARHRQAHSLPGDVGTAIDQAILWARDDKCSYPADAEKFDQRIEILRAALTSSAPEPVQKLHELLAKASALQVGPSNEGHRIAIYFDDHNEAGKLFAALSDRAALATEVE